MATGGSEGYPDIQAMRAQAKARRKGILPRDSAAKVSSDPKAVLETQGPLTCTSFTISGRIDRSSDIQKELGSIHEALPLLVRPTSRSGGVPAVMWHKLSHEQFEVVEELDEGHKDGHKDDDEKGSFVLKGISRV